MSTIAAPRAAVMGPLRDWLRTDTAVAAICGQRVYIWSLPPTAALPAVALSKVGLTPDGTVTEQTLVQADCWAARDGGGPVAENLAAAVKTALEQATPGTALGSSSVRLMGASIEAEVALPDPDDGSPRYVVTALVTTKVVA